MIIMIKLCHYLQILKLQYSNYTGYKTGTKKKILFYFMYVNQIFN